MNISWSSKLKKKKNHGAYEEGDTEVEEEREPGFYTARLPIRGKGEGTGAGTWD